MSWRSNFRRGDATTPPRSDVTESDPSERSGLIDVEVVDRSGNSVATLILSLVELQAEAETRAGVDGDPIAAMQSIVEQRLRDAGADLSAKGATALRKAVSNAVMNNVTVRRIDLEGSRVTKESSAQSGREARSLPPELFEQVLVYPNDKARRQYEMLVGLDEIKRRLEAETIVLTQPKALEEWARDKHGTPKLRALATIDNGAPLIIFAGDVGSGKTALAESFGDAVGRRIGKKAVLLRMSIQTRGGGFVGDMTKQITLALRSTETEARRSGHLTILLLDEADALAESRETKQMHHEDRAGVNALIQGVDHLRGTGLPVLVVFCTNRISSVDPAIQRRAVEVFQFNRPNSEQRRALLQKLLGDLGFSEKQWGELVALTGPLDTREYGFTYSDIADRLVRTAIVEAFPAVKLSFEIVKRIAERMAPTRPFGANDIT